MEIEFKNIGFIKQGKIKTNNITIIFGPNNVGKTYLSYSTYAAISKYNEIFKSKIKVPKSVSSELVLNGKGRYDLTNVFTDHLMKTVNDEVSSSLPAFFKDSFDMFSNSKINVIDTYIQERVIAAEVNLNISVSEHIILNIQKKKSNSWIDFSVASAKKDTSTANPIGELKEKDASNYLNLLFNFFFLNEVLDSAANNAFIITSERTGISLFQKEIDSNRSNMIDSFMWNKISGNKVLSFDELVSKRVAKFSEPINHNINIVRDFSDVKKMQHIRSSNGLKIKNKEHAVIIKSLESLTGGSYSISNGETIYTVKCKDGNHVSMPLSLSSASNKALFLLDLYVRYYMTHNSYLIIDEPELNLHPQNQIKMAELLVRLSNYGVKIIITTHSDFIVKEINNRVMASKIKDKSKLSTLGYESIDLIKHSEVNGFTIEDSGLICEVGVNQHGINAFIFDNVITEIETKTDTIYSYIEEGF
ncbi:AAA family ATPase [Pectobacterium odoriferum]|uniref:AAA family ATPase n=1 Tax=Pectobacterium odoriferum TaxID=78398 RepID=UPI000CD29CF2|nr:AAA family ATPase [Pectobacterium odoriferum]POE38581.1 hypothetical protein BV920_16485 [Pectobacterium odoriferum]